MGSKLGQVITNPILGKDYVVTNPVKLPTIPASRIATIAAQIEGVISPLVPAAKDAKGLRDAWQVKNADNVGLRVKMMGEVASLSETNGWLEDEIETAAKMVVSLHVKLQNDPDAGKDKFAKTTLSQMVSQVKLAAHPKVCVNFSHLNTLLDTAWAYEDALREAEKELADTPLRKAFQRKYHALVGLMKAMKSNFKFANEEALVEYARANDPDKDAEKVSKRVQKVIASLNAIYQDFAHEDLKSAADFLGQINSHDLLKFKRVAEELVTEDTTTTPTTTQATSTPEPAEGVFDTDAIINGITELGLAA